MENLRVLCLDQVKIHKHGFVGDIKEDWLDPKTEPFSNFCKRAEKEGLNYNFENECLTVWRTKIDYESNWQYRLFWHDYPILKIGELEIK